MKKIILLFSVLFITVVISCDNKEDEPETVATCSDGIQNGSETGVDCGGGCNSCDGLEWTLIATDVAGDAANSGLDATRLSYQYDITADVVRFRAEVANLSIFSDSPSADFSFGLPNGTANDDPPGFHWTDENQVTPVHRTAAIYCDTGGTPPSTYTYNQNNATNSIYLTADPSNVDCVNCISILVDPAANFLVYSIDRNKIISNVEMEGSDATIKLVANVGHNIGWDDNITLTGTFTIPYNQVGNLATLSTNPITDISNSTAVSGGNITDDGGSAVTMRGICYGTSPNPTLASNIVESGAGTGTYSSNISGLSTNTTYYVRAFATNSSGTAYGNQFDFATSGLAIVNTVSVSSITVNSADIEGEVISNGGTYVAERGFAYSTTPNPTINDFKLAAGSGTGNFSGTIPGLTAGTEYFVRSYATNSAGTAYGNEVVFRTLGLPAVTTSPFDVLSLFSAAGGGNVTSDGGAPVTTRGVCWSTSINPTLSNSNVSIGNGTGSFNATINGLSQQRKYYIRAFAVNEVGVAYGENVEIFTIVVGYNYLGGIIAHIDETGEHGLIISTNDLATFEQWRDPATSPPVYTNATSAAIGDGLLNTNLITGAQGNAGVYAARSCRNLIIGGQSDWYLPTKGELNLIYINADAIGNITPNVGYWSSTEKDYNDAWIQNLTNGVQSFTTKLNFNHVRAMRSF